jgi:lipoprotein-anchoring transpeptidase ErfK/SrfK
MGRAVIAGLAGAAMVVAGIFVPAQAASLSGSALPESSQSLSAPAPTAEVTSATEPTDLSTVFLTRSEGVQAASREAVEKEMVHKVSFTIDNQVITGFARVRAGAVLVVRDVPPNSTVEIYGYSDPSDVVPIRQTTRARVYRSDPLPPSARFYARVIAPDESSVRVNFATGPAPQTFTVSVSPREGSGIYGAGIPLRVTFSRPIENRAAVERAMKVDSTKKLGAASWHWVSSTMAVFRPKKYWPGNTRVTLNADLRRVEAAPGVFGPNVTSSFRIGDQVIIRTNFTTKKMLFFRNGKLERTFPISGGKRGWETRDGTKLITTHEKQRRLINPDPVDGWNVLTNYAMRLTTSGEFIHDAPWNLYNLGRYNTSHGCTNMTIPDAAWVFNNTRFADVVVSSGSGVRVSKSEHLAGYWNYSWKEWLAGSAVRS